MDLPLQPRVAGSKTRCCAQREQQGEGESAEGNSVALCLCQLGIYIFLWGVAYSSLRAAPVWGQEAFPKGLGVSCVLSGHYIHWFRIFFFLNLCNLRNFG